jgi:hypothetical protein
VKLVRGLSTSASATPLIFAGVLAALALSLNGCGLPDAMSSKASESGKSDSQTASELYSISGRVVSLPGRQAQVCAFDVVLTADASANAAIEPCNQGVNTLGLDLDRLEYRHSYAGAIEGWARVIGRWDGSTLQVVDQFDLDPPKPGPFFQAPPCPRPVGGWLRIQEGDNLDSRDVRGFVDSHAGTRAAVLRPSSVEAVWLISTPDVQAAEAGLPTVPANGKCIVRAAYSEQAYRDAELAFPLGEQLGAIRHSVGPPDADGQWRLHVQVLYLTEELLSRERAQAPGLVRLEPALRQI